MAKVTRRIPSPKHRGAAQRGVALILVMIFLALMLLLGVANLTTSMTEVSVGRNLRLATDAFDVADAGASHAHELVRNMRGDFTCLIRGLDDGASLKNGDEFKQRPAKTFNLAGAVIQTSGNMFNEAFVRVIPDQACADGVTRALVQLDPRHYYELVVYDNASDPKSYLADATAELAMDTLNRRDIDGDQRVLIRSIGYVMRTDVDDPADFSPALAESTAVVDVVIGLTPYPAVLTNDDLEITNSVEITGALGGVHANDDLVLGTGNFTIAQSATYGNATGDTPPSGANATIDNSHVTGYNGSADVLYIPDLNPYDYAANCDYVFIQKAATVTQRQALLAKLGAPATAAFTAASLDPLSTTLNFALRSNGLTPPTYTITSSSSNNWTYTDGATAATTISVALSSGGAGGASVSNIPDYVAPPAKGKSVFVLLPGPASDVTMNGGTSGQVTLLTNANIKLNGNANLKPSLTIVPPQLPPWDRVDLLALAGEDVSMLGNSGGGDLIEGVIYAHEQFDLSGSGSLSGQVVGYDRKLTFDVATTTYKTDTSASPWNTTGSPVGAHGSIVHGNFEIVHNISRGYLGNFALAAWRELRDYDPATATRP